jgi:hypothetical protein
MNRFEIYRTISGEWSVLDTETDEAIPPRLYEDAEEIAHKLNTFPWAVDMYAWNSADPEWYDEDPEDDALLDNLWSPEVVPRPEIGEARQLATGLSMLGNDRAAQIILNLIALVEEN